MSSNQSERRRAASNSTIPAATATLRLSAAPPMGMLTTSSAASSHAGETPCRSLPTTDGDGALDVVRPPSTASRPRGSRPRCAGRSDAATRSRARQPPPRAGGRRACPPSPGRPRGGTGSVPTARDEQRVRRRRRRAVRTIVPRLPGRSIPSATATSGAAPSRSAPSPVGQPLHDRGEPVRARAAGDGAESVGAQLDDAGATRRPLAARARPRRRRGRARARRTPRAAARPASTRAAQRPVALDEERVHAATPTEPPDLLQPRVRGARDEGCCHALACP